mgnify:FL=1
MYKIQGHDHIDAIMRIIYDGEVGSTYNIGGSKTEIKNIEVVKKICSYMDDFNTNRQEGTHSHDLIEFVEDRPGHDKRYAIDSSKIQNELSWSPQVCFDEGLKDTVRWYLDNESWWQAILERPSVLDRQGRT